MDLLCIQCKGRAFAVVTIAIDAGSAHWPVCANARCIGRTVSDVETRLTSAAGSPREVIDVSATEVEELAP